MSPDIKKLEDVIKQNIEYLNQSSVSLEGIFFSTVDGFMISSFIKKNKDIKADRMAAIISSFFGISNATAKEISHDKTRNIIIELEKSILVIVSFMFENKTYLAASLSDNKNNMGQVVFITHAFVKKISNQKM